jgi:hypothetical protein
MQDFAAADRATPRYLEKYPAMVHNQTPFYYSRQDRLGTNTWSKKWSEELWRFYR